MRNKLAEILIGKGITDQAVLNAIRTIPRHLFLDSGFEVQRDDKILEIGTGSGYQTAVLLKLKARVYTIERQLELFKKTNLFFDKMGYRPKKTIFGDGYKGLPEEAPFDGIIVTAGAPYVPNPLLAQLKIGGRLVIPVGIDEQVMTLYERKSAKEFEKKELGSFRFVPLLEDKN
jgi:protein-L-isoaspartate(D-aspartate) O-methyltransferase